MRKQIPLIGERGTTIPGDPSEAGFESKHSTPAFLPEDTCRKGQQVAGVFFLTHPAQVLAPTPFRKGRVVGNSEVDRMLVTIVVILVVLWLLGLVTSHTMGGLIHVLLVIAVVVFLLRVIGG